MQINCDKLTDIPNVDSLINRLSMLEKVNIFLINLDNFSNINNAYGYEVGDIVLQNTAKYLTLCKPQTASLYRFYADKFVLLDEGELTAAELGKSAESILSFFSESEITIDDDIEFKLSLSIGISRAARGTINLTQAEIAIDELRICKRNHFNIFDPSSSYVHAQQQNIYWIHKIKEAVVNEEIVAYFQPIINNHTSKVEKFECLARIKDDDEIISPFMFLEAAKLTGNLSYITKSLIAQSFKKFSNTDYEFSINITGDDLSQGYLEFLLLKNVNKYGIHPSRVVLEMLEDIATLGDGTTLSQLQSLRENGFKVAIDDFGAENSNLSRLLEIEPDYLKIDGAFIKNIIADKKSQIIVDAIILICKRSGIKIIAEYIHDEEVQNRVKELGIDYSQGFYFGAPSPELKDIL
jgi:diguanylate cyclase (GGDEF)-like protein